MTKSVRLISIFTLYVVGGLILVSLVNHTSFSSHIMNSFDDASENDFLDAFSTYEKRQEREVLFALSFKEKSKKKEFNDLSDTVSRLQKDLQQIGSWKERGKVGIERESIAKYVFLNKAFLLPQKYITQFNDNELANNAISKLYNPFGSGGASFSVDPLFLNDYFWSNLYNPTSLILKNGHLYHPKTKSIFWTAEITENKSKQALKALMDLKTKYKKRGFEFHYLSPSFYNELAKVRAEKESLMFGILSLVLIVTVFLIFFRSIFPLVSSGLTILYASIAGLASLKLFYDEVEWSALLMSLSALGIIVDFIIHFHAKEFVVQKEHGLNIGNKIVRDLIKPVSLGLITTLLGFICFYFSGILFLQQFAVFSAFSLVVAYTLVIFVMPAFACDRKMHWNMKLSKPIFVFLSKRRKILLNVLSVLFIGSFCALFYGHEDRADVRSLGNDNLSLKKDELFFKNLLGITESPNYLIVKGRSSEELLQNEENIRNELSESLIKFNSISMFIPSQRNIKKASLNIKKLNQQVRFLSQKLNIQLNGYKVVNDFDMTIDRWVSSFPDHFSSKYFLGKKGDSFYSVIPLYSKLINKFNGENLFVYNKIDNINELLRNIKKYSLLGLVTASFLLSCLFCLIWGISSGLSLILPVVTATTCTLAIVQFLNPTLNVFHILGSLLIFCLGIDYSFFYFFRSDELEELDRGVILSSLTTFFAFGVLALSSTNGVHSFGIVVAIGIGLSLIFSPLAHRGLNE